MEKVVKSHDPSVRPAALGADLAACRQVACYGRRADRLQSQHDRERQDRPPVSLRSSGNTPTPPNAPDVSSPPCTAEIKAPTMSALARAPQGLAAACWADRRRLSGQAGPMTPDAELASVNSYGRARGCWSLATSDWLECSEFVRAVEDQARYEVAPLNSPRKRRMCSYFASAAGRIAMSCRR
jgi:hypothetical protein